LEDSKSVDAGHLEVEEDDAGKGVLGAVVVGFVAGEVGDGFGAVGHFDEGVFDPEFFESASDEEAIVGIVVDEEDDLVAAGTGTRTCHGGTEDRRR
jgi:hypothetical protein